MENALISYCEIYLTDPVLILHPLAYLLVEKIIRNHSFYRDKLASYSRSFYSVSAPTNTLPSHDLFTLDFSGIWNLQRMHNIGQQLPVQKERVGVASGFCFNPC